MRDKGCLFPGRGVGEPEGHAHHVVPWWQGGRSDLTNLVLLCPHLCGLVEPTRLHGDKATSRWEVGLLNPRASAARYFRHATLEGSQSIPAKKRVSSSAIWASATARVTVGMPSPACGP